MFWYYDSMLQILKRGLLWTGLLLYLSTAVYAYADLDAFVTRKLGQMTLEEKLGQMIMVDVKASRVTPKIRTFLQRGKIAGVLLFQFNLRNHQQAKQLVAGLQEIALQNLKTPMLIAIDQEGGTVNRLKKVVRNAGKARLMKMQARSLGNLYRKSPEQGKRQVVQIARQSAQLLKSIGVTMNLAPVLDMAHHRGAFIYKRSFGADPKLVQTLAGQYIDALHAEGIIATGKHFPNLGNTSEDSHGALPRVNRSLSELSNHEWVPFKGLRDKLPAILVSHVLLPQLDKRYPASLSKKILGYLRNDIGFQGVILCDDIRMKALSERFSLKDMAVNTILAGIDIIVVIWDPEKQLAVLQHLKAAVRTGRLSLERIDASVRRILKLKYRRKVALAQQ